MALCKNGVNLTTIAETNAGANDPRLKLDWVKPKQRFIVPYDWTFNYNNYTLSDITTDFRVQSNTGTTFAAKGARPYLRPYNHPSYTQADIPSWFYTEWNYYAQNDGYKWDDQTRLEQWGEYMRQVDKYEYRSAMLTPDTYYIHKNINNSVYLSHTLPIWNQPPAADYTEIGTATENLKVLIFELQGAGGGGGYGGWVEGGVGGAGGAYALGALCLQLINTTTNDTINPIYKIVIGRGGNGTYWDIKGNGETGQSSTLSSIVDGVEKLIITANGGQGGQSSGATSNGGTIVIDTTNKLIHVWHSQKGVDAPKAKYTTSHLKINIGLETEKQEIDRPSVTCTDHNGGPGGSSPFGKANDGKGGTNDGTHGQTPGSGGGGGTGGRKGGAEGAAGCCLLYY